MGNNGIRRKSPQPKHASIILDLENPRDLQEYDKS